MRTRSSVILVCCVLAIVMSVSSILEAQAPKDKRRKALKERLYLPTRSSVPRQILSFRTREEAIKKLKKEEQPILSPKSHMYAENYILAQGVAGANADTRNGRVWAVAMYDGLDPYDLAHAGFKSIGLRNIGSSRQAGVTVKVTANILNLTAQEPHAALCILIFEDGRPIRNKIQYFKMPGSQVVSLTSDPFMMFPNHNYYALALISISGKPKAGRAVSVIADIIDIKWKF